MRANPEINRSEFGTKPEDETGFLGQFSGRLSKTVKLNRTVFPVSASAPKSQKKTKLNY